MAQDPADLEQGEFLDLLHRVRQGCQEACRELVLLYAPGLKVVIRDRLRRDRLLRRHADSSDMMQLVWSGFFGTAAAMREWDMPETMAFFLARMATNLILNHRRHHLDCQKRDARRQQSLDELLDLADPRPTPPVLVAYRDFWAELLRSVPEMKRRIATMLSEGHTHPDIARAVGVTERTVGRVVVELRSRL